MLNYIDKNLNKNKYGLLLFIISIILTKNIISNQIIIKTKKKIIDINQYIYYFPQKQIILCSDKLFKNTEINLIPNEIKIKENEFICMINLKNNNNYNNNNYININLHIILPISNNSNKDSLDIFLGDTLVFKNLHFKNNKESSNSYQNIYTKKMIVKINNNKDVFFLNEENFKNNYINNNNNNIYFDNFLNFQAAKDSLFKGNHLMLNIKLNLDKVNKGLSFMEKNTKVKLVSKINTNIKNNNETSNNNFKPLDEVCDPPCINGVCFNLECYCYNGFMGEDCGSKVESKDFRLGISLLIIFAISSFFLGILLAVIGTKILYCILNKDEDREKSEDIDVMEKWTLAQQN